MVGKKLTVNLKSYLEPLVDVPVYAFDRNESRSIPCLIVGYDSEETTIKGGFGHYTVSGFVDVLFQGYDDQENLDSDSLAFEVADYLADRQALETALNKPLSGSDSRPLTGFGINQLIIRGTQREEQDHSSLVQINFDAFCVAKDF